MAVTHAEFQEFFLSKRNGTYKCVFCSKEVFVLNGIENGALAAFFVFDGKKDWTEGPGVAHGFYSVSCANCGRADFFSGVQVHQWLEMKKTEATTNAG